jgi:hypothetical protein
MEGIALNILFVALGAIGILLIVLYAKKIIPESWGKVILPIATALITLGIYPLIKMLTGKKKAPVVPIPEYKPEAASEGDRESLDEEAKTVDEKLDEIDASRDEISVDHADSRLGNRFHTRLLNRLRSGNTTDDSND